MPKEISRRIGHVIVEFERGYLDFDLQAQTITPARIVNAYNPKYFVPGVQETFRTR
jgi:hypothetical protein